MFRLCCALLLVSTLSLASHAAMSPLKVSENHRFLVKEDGTPFFYLGDTAWEIFHRLKKEDADAYLTQRAKNGYTVIQAVALAEFDGLNKPNAYGFKPLIDNDPTKPDVKDGPDNDYWDNVDYIVEKANSVGIYVGMLPTWGDKWNKKWGQGPEIFTPSNAEIYGEWLGKRYKDKGIIWIMGGDRPVETDAHKEIISAMVRGIKKGDGGAHLMTFHPSGGHGSSQYWHEADWLSFNMRQNGHGQNSQGYMNTHADYNKTPIKPVLDGEPIYEDHPIAFNAKENGHSVAADVRRALYWDLFQGAFGHTYGHHSVWSFHDQGREPVNTPLMYWREAIEQPGAKQMQFGRKLIESRPFLTRIPDDSIIVKGNPETAIPGIGLKHMVATRDESGTYAFIYTPVGRSFKIHMDKITGSKVKAWWFNPRNGEATAIGEFENKGEQSFSTPDMGEMIDWVLVLDDASKNYPAPGK